MHRPHRHLHREGREEGKPEPGLHLRREVVLQKCCDIGRAGIPVHGHDGEQHQHRAEQRVEEELVRRVDAVLATPNADDDEHRDQAGFEEDIEEHDVERHEDADHQGLEDQEGDHVFLQTLLDRGPARENAEGHEQSRQDDEEHRDAIDADMVGDPRAEPGVLLHHLEADIGIVEVDPDEERHDEGEDRRQQRDVQDVAAAERGVTTGQQKQSHADQRKEGDRRENGPIGHQRELPSIIQVTRAAMPMSIAKA